METASTASSPWKTYQKIGFRFALIFFLLFIMLLDWSANPVFSYLYYYGNLANVLDGLIAWVGHELFQIPYVIVSPYDGEHNDRTYVYLLYFTIGVMAVFGTIIWSLLDRKRPGYNLLYYWFTVIIRYYLAFTMFLFGLYKFFRVQFPDLGYYTLTAQVGDMSPMHLAWSFFGYAHGYNVFMGIAECGGLLLLFRRTTTFGALLVMGALANVIAVNVSFDVHAKMYPIALFAMALFLVLKDARRISRFFFTGQAVSLPKIQPPVFSRQWMYFVKTGAKILVIGYFLIGHVMNNIGYRKYARENIKANVQYAGMYEVDLFVVNGDTLPADHPTRWQQLIIGDQMLDAVRLEGDSIAFLSVKSEDKEILVSGNPTQLLTNRQIIYNELGNTDDTYRKMDSLLVARQMVSRFQFELADSTTLSLRGTMKNDSVSVIARRKPLDINDFRLMKRRFHWVNEASYFY